MDKQLLNELIEYRNYLYALECYQIYGDKYGDKLIIEQFEEKHKMLEKKIKNENIKNYNNSVN